MTRAPEIELSDRELNEWLARAMTDTGFVCRELLGFNYDLDHKTNRRVNVGSGGVREGEPYEGMARFLANPEIKFGMLLASRGGLKSSEAAGDAVRHLIADPDDALLYMSATDKQVRRKSGAIRRAFENSKMIRRLWGNPRPDPKSGLPWTIDEWTISRRRDMSRDAASFTTGSLKRPPVGGHYNKIYLDDLIDWRNCRTEDQLEMARYCLKHVMPLRTPGALIRVLGTRYHAGDIYSYIDTIEGWSRLVIGCGFDVEKQPDGSNKLVGGPPTFPHLTESYLAEQLATMDYEDFYAQYINKLVAGTHEVFRREWLQPIQRSSINLREMTLWLVTDLALSTSNQACMSVAIMVAMDSQRRCFLLDAFVGRVETGQFVDEIFGLIVKWQHEGQWGGFVGERVSIGTVLINWLRTEEMKRGIRLNIREIPRGGAVSQKDARIERLQPKMRARDFYVVTDSFPRFFMNRGKQAVLYDPLGFIDPNTQQRLPSGKLVDQFVLHPYQGETNKDMADCLSDLEHVYPNKEPACYWIRPFHVAYTRPQLDRGGPGGADWLRRLGSAPRSSR